MFGGGSKVWALTTEQSFQLSSCSRALSWDAVFRRHNRCLNSLLLHGLAIDYLDFFTSLRNNLTLSPAIEFVLSLAFGTPHTLSSKFIQLSSLFEKWRRHLSHPIDLAGYCGKSSL